MVLAKEWVYLGEIAGELVLTVAERYASIDDIDFMI
jgi:hypothetical protein